MTAIDPFTTPAEAERQSRVKQANDFFALAMTPEHLSMWTGNSNHLDYENGVQAVRDALVGQGHAMLAVRDELADIAASLRTLAAMPSAVTNVALAVTSVQETLTELSNDVCDVHAAVKENTAAAVDMGDGLTDAVRDLTDVIDRPRWWQWRRRRFIRRLRAAVASEPARGQVAGGAKVHDGDFRVDLHQGRDPWDVSVSVGSPQSSRRFRVENGMTPCQAAQALLPNMCEQAGVPAEPGEMHGQLYACDRDGTALWFIDTVFLPGATVIEAPEGGF